MKRCDECGKRIWPLLRAHIGRWSEHAPEPWPYRGNVASLHGKCYEAVLAREAAKPPWRIDFYGPDGVTSAFWDEP